MGRGFDHSKAEERQGYISKLLFLKAKPYS
jgi:hypothetical protein